MSALALWLAALSQCGPAEAQAPPARTLEHAPFGQLAVYMPPGAPSHAVIFLSGDGGWNLGVVDMATSIAAMDAVVVGVDVNQYRAALQKSPDSCVSLAVDLENLSHWVEHELGLQRYSPPVVVGYSSGATLAYAALAQAPAGTFSGAMSLGFCPEVPLQQKLCSGEGVVTRAAAQGKAELEPKSALAAPWAVLQGTIDQVCSADVTSKFAQGVASADLVTLPNVGHGFSVQRNWLPQFKAAFSKIVAATPAPAPLPAALADLPLTEIPATRPGSTLAVMISGDGGWAGLDKAVAAAFAAKGIGVVGLDSLQYFWQAKSPEQAGTDLTRIIDAYVHAWQPTRVVVVGYSFGADVLPFMINRAAAQTRASIKMVALVAPGQNAQFEFHLSSWLGLGPSGAATLPEVTKLAGEGVVCIHGSQETGSLCPTLPKGFDRDVTLPGGHHFNGDYQAIADAILAALEPSP